MSHFIEALSFMFSFLPAWVWIVFAACFTFLIVIIVLKVIKVILDAIPFV